MGIQHVRQKTLYNKSIHGDPYKAGELVWLHCPAVPRGKSPKLHRYWQGPYTVVRSLGDALFLIQHRDSPRKRTVVHFDRMKPCTVLASEENVAPAKDDNTGVPAVARGLLHSNGDVGEDQLRDEVEVEIRAPVPETHPVGELLPVAEPPPVHVAEPLPVAEPPPVAEPLPVVEPPPVIQSERTRPVRHRSKPDRYGHNIYET